MPPSLNKQSSSQQSNNRNIRDFFKPFTIPKNRIPVNDVVEDEIVVAPVSERASSSVRSGSESPSKSRNTAERRAKGLNGTASPTKASRSPVKSKHVPTLDGAEDDDSLHHESPSGSQQRVMTAVEIPTPTKPRAPSETNMNANANMANISFNSTSSLTSLPMSSQASSSRRVVKNGVPAVTNSDSGSAEDSEDELQDIVIPRKKMRMTPPPVVPGADAENAIEVPSTVKPAGRHRHLGRLEGKKGTSRRRFESSPPRPASTNSLLKLVREKERQEKAEARIREAETAFEEEQKLREDNVRRERDLGGGLKALVADDSDEGERMMLAVERTEAMDREDDGDFFYFRGVNETKANVREPRREGIEAFVPWKGQEYARAKKMILDPVMREQAALTGMLAEVAGNYGLPPALMQWMFGRLVRETREELCEAYVEVFRRYVQQFGSPGIQHQDDWACFSRIYRTFDTLPNRDGSMPVSNEKFTKPDGPPPGLRYVTRVVQHTCSNNGRTIPVTNFVELALASVDAHVVRDAELKGQLQDSIAAVVESTIPTGTSGFADTFLRSTETFSLPLRCRIIASLPAFTEKCHRLRRVLALHILSDRPASLSKTKVEDSTMYCNSQEWVQILLDGLRSAPEWTISESTNYAHLNALIPILDIAIDAGFQPFPARTPPNPTESEPHGVFPTPPQSPDEKTFNKQIDALTSQLRALSARIRDAGTSHLRRTEAKSALERVVVRLEHCVRTRPKKRKGVFGGGEGKGFMEGFVARTRDKEVKGRDPEDWVSVVDEGRLSDREGDGDAQSEENDARGGAEDDF